jgi:hypothetical protein
VTHDIIDPLSIEMFNRFFYFNFILTYKLYNALDKYNAELKKAGFKTMKIASLKGGSVTGEKGKLIVSSFVGEGKGMVSVQIRTDE